MKTKIKEYQKLIYNQLETISKNWQNRGILAESMNYTLLNVGKLARPMIVMLGLDELGKLDESAASVAASLEMIQTYSLVHDDLPEMDNATFRRKKTANHLVYGHGQALLAGDALLTDSFLVLANTSYESKVKIELVRLFAEKAGSNGVCYGQSIDLINEEKPFESWQQIENILKHKTCALFELAFETIGIIAQVDDNKRKLLNKIGYQFGIVFQIKDDLDDTLKTKAELGKDNLQDQNKNTYHKIYGIDNAKLKINHLMIEIENDIKTIFGKNSTIIEYLKGIIE